MDDLRRRLDEQDLAVDDYSIEAGRCRGQSVLQFLRQVLFRNARRQRLAACEVPGDTGRQIALATTIAL